MLIIMMTAADDDTETTALRERVAGAHNAF